MEEEQQENETKNFGQPKTPGKPQHGWRCMALGCLSPHGHTHPPHDTASLPRSQGGHRGCCFCRKHHTGCSVGCMRGWGGSKHGSMGEAPALSLSPSCQPRGTQEAGASQLGHLGGLALEPASPQPITGRQEGSPAAGILAPVGAGLQGLGWRRGGAKHISERLFVFAYGCPGRQKVIC